MATTPATDPNIYHLDDISKASKRNLQSNNTLIPVANPVAATTLVENDERKLREEQLTKFSTTSGDIPKNSEHLPQSLADGSPSQFPTNISNDRKVILNVGGVKHESGLIFFIFLFLFRVVFHLFLRYMYSFVAYTFSFAKYTARSFGKITSISFVVDLSNAA